MKDAVDGELAVSYPSLPEPSGISKADRAKVEGAGVGVVERLLVQVLKVERLCDAV